MASLIRISLTCDATQAATLQVARVQVKEAISDIYTITVDTLTDTTALDIRPLLGKAAAIALEDELARRRSFYGIVSEVAVMGAAAGRLWHRLTIVPPIAALALTRRSRCFVTTGSDTTSRKVRAVLASTVATAITPIASTADFGLSGTYADLGAAIQYDETDLDFLRRTAEKAGLGWFFPDGQESKQVKFVDDVQNYPVLAGRAAFNRSPTSILSARLTSRLAPLQAETHSWDPANPATVLDCVTPAPSPRTGSPIGFGATKLYEQGYTTAAIGNALAAIRRDEAAAQREILSGQSVEMSFTPGYNFTYADADAAWLGGQYLLTAVTHHAWQSVYGSESLPGIDIAADGYSNTFEAVPLANGYRPARRTPAPRSNGLLRATVCDSTGAITATLAAYLDKQGRYQVLLPFPDAAGTTPSRLLTPVRMMTPFGGSKERWHMPLRPGTTVFLSFEDGDIDRPYIAGLLSNNDQPSPLPAKDSVHQTIISSASGITLKMTDGTTLVVAGGA